MALSNTMTLLFTDLVGSTAMGDRLGDDDAETVRRRFFQIIEEAVEPTGGRIVKTLGDGHMVAFASALDAIGCAIAIQGGVDTYNSEHGAETIGVRVGINAGDVTVEGDDYFGTPVTIAKRLCDSAEGGQILVSGLVESLVGSRGGFAFHSLGTLELRGLSRPQSASEVVWRGSASQPDGAAPAPPARPTAPAGGKPPKRSRRGAVIAAVVGVVALAAIATAVVKANDDNDAKDDARTPSDVQSPTLGSSTVSGKKLVDLISELPTMDSTRDFDFEVEAGDVVRIDATRRQADVDLVAELRAPDGTLIAFDDDSGPGNEPQISAKLPEAGSYSVVVRMFAPETNGGFNLTVTKLAPTADVGTNLSFGEFTGDGGVFETPVDLTEGQSISVVTFSEPVNIADLFLELIGPDGQVVASDDDSGEYSNPLIKDYEVPSSGTYTIRIHPVEDADAGAFWVRVDQA
ncbi:hypothetical protein F0U44_00760 [Nocardioides humilatus]|uniref:Guanylate cyclase domain-containing protein n=1 Tax=Nocardioides humilatus TaxID=2607660 RepID=A0A5B1LJM1_9ACTN|nr:pre-peptidase C-terminal domain-containing protein [Nocardioides humilatus]KAA1420911.1 hypothetical protein F0U44_00760 [Nocardioides humilatus]